MPLRRPPLNLIEPDPNDSAAHHCPLRLQHVLAATAPHFYVGTKPRYVDALHLFLAQEQSNAVINEVTGQSLDLHQLLQYPNKSTCRTSLANNIDRLTQGVGTRMPCGTNTVFYVPKSSAPADC